jgi:TrmH family RNA methyltransferase
VLGPRNPEVQRLRKILSSRRVRREERIFALEGPELLTSALGASWPLDALYVDEDAHGQALEDALARADAAGLARRTLKAGVLAQVADAVAPQGCVAVAQQRPWRREDLRTPIVIVLDRINDPGNLGAVVRVAEATRSSVMLTAGSTDPWGPKALRASTGSMFRTPVVEGGDIDEVLTVLRRDGRRVVGTSSHRGADFASLEWPRPMVLVFGTEAAGLDESVLASVDDVVSIPLPDTVESLNLSVAAGILTVAASRGLRASTPSSSASTMLPMHGGRDQ